MLTSRTIRSLLFALVMLAIPAVSLADIILSINIAPPPLPVYAQPQCPGDGYLWTPGYWAYAQEGYFWVPGTWVSIPEPGFLWTPGYWGWNDSLYVFHEGYWGAQVGFYGGINYGFGYGGVGYGGGYWNNGAFFYNRSVNNVVNIKNVYTKTVVVNKVHVSYNGGTGGITARPTREEEAAGQARHIPPTAVQTSHVQAAAGNHQLYESVNHGKPAVAATAKPGEFSGHGVVAAKAAAPSYKPATARAAVAGGAPATTAVHPKELPPAERPAAPNTGKPKVDKKYQQQQQQLGAKQDQQRKQLQQKQDQDHQRLAQQKAPPAKTQQLEQTHQQQTQQLQQKHTQEQQKLQVRQQPANHTAAKEPAKAPEEKR